MKISFELFFKFLKKDGSFEIPSKLEPITIPAEGFISFYYKYKTFHTHNYIS
jgi:hypothetical protein